MAEDNSDDQLLLRYAFRNARLPNKFHMVNNGAEAITWLQSSLDQPNNLLFPMPGLVVLDIHMPYKNGLEVLEWIRSQPAFAELPVVIMSGVRLPEMVDRALQLGARNYLFKPGDYSELTGFIYDFNLLHSLHHCADAGTF